MDKRIQIASLLVCVIVWALTFPVIKFLLGYFNPVSLSMFRYGIGALALLPFLLRDRRKMVSELKAIGILFPIFALFTIPFPDLLQNFGMRMMDRETVAPVTSILQPMSPVFTLILAALFLREKVTGRKVLGILMAFAGAIMLSTGGDLKIGDANSLGAFLILLSALSYAISGIIGKHILHDTSPEGVMIWGYVFGALFLFPVWAYEPQVPSLDAWGLLALLFLSIGTLFPYLLWYKVLEHNEVSAQTAFVFLIPLFGVLFSALLMGERLSPYLLMWGLLILAGVYLTQSGSPSPEGKGR